MELLKIDIKSNCFLDHQNCILTNIIELTNKMQGAYQKYHFFLVNNRSFQTQFRFHSKSLVFYQKVIDLCIHYKQITVVSLL